jgi:hypothetical protein
MEERTKQKQQDAAEATAEDYSPARKVTPQ